MRYVCNIILIFCFGYKRAEGKAKQGSSFTLKALLESNFNYQLLSENSQKHIK